MPNEVTDFLYMSKSEYKIHIDGLMCIPPAKDSSKNYFEDLFEIAKKNKINKLSMGMSNDYEEALQQGASHIRIGTSIFGERS